MLAQRSGHTHPPNSRDPAHGQQEPPPSHGRAGTWVSGAARRSCRRNRAGNRDRATPRPVPAASRLRRVPGWGVRGGAGGAARPYPLHLCPAPAGGGGGTGCREAPARSTAMAAAEPGPGRARKGTAGAGPGRGGAPGAPGLTGSISPGTHGQPAPGALAEPGLASSSRLPGGDRGERAGPGGGLQTDPPAMPPLGAGASVRVSGGHRSAGTGGRSCPPRPRFVRPPRPGPWERVGGRQGVPRGVPPPEAGSWGRSGSPWRGRRCRRTMAAAPWWCGLLQPEASSPSRSPAPRAPRPEPRRVPRGVSCRWCQSGLRPHRGRGSPGERSRGVTSCARAPRGAQPRSG